MARLIPFLICFAFGFVVGRALFHRRVSGPGRDQRGSGDLEGRERAPAPRVGAPSGAEVHVNRLRQTLWDVRGMLSRPEALTPRRVETIVAEVDAALDASRPAGEPGRPT